MYKIIQNKVPLLTRTSRILLNNKNRTLVDINITKEKKQEKKEKENEENEEQQSFDIENGYEAEFQPSLDYNVEKYKDE